MEISFEETTTEPVVTIMKLVGELDSSTAASVSEKGKELFAAGAQNLLLDMSDLSFMGSSGLVTLHNLANIMRGDRAIGDQSATSLHDLKFALMNATEKESCFRLLSPQPRIAKTLKITGFDKLLHIYDDRAEAIASFA